VSDLYIHEKLRNIIKERIDLIDTQLTEGVVEDFSIYKILRAKREELANIEQELDVLLKKVNYD
jgi:hypothetical protein|tara:strand:- start:1068 stop:1259 length:192 start_codon:yes stop_codon:yes gene_type:complete